MDDSLLLPPSFELSSLAPASSPLSNHERPSLASTLPRSRSSGTGAIRKVKSFTFWRASSQSQPASEEIAPAPWPSPHHSRSLNDRHKDTVVTSCMGRDSFQGSSSTEEKGEKAWAEVPEKHEQALRNSEADTRDGLQPLVASRVFEPPKSVPRVLLPRRKSAFSFWSTPSSAAPTSPSPTTPHPSSVSETIPTLPPLQLSSSPYRMSWNLSAGTPPKSSTPSITPAQSPSTTELFTTSVAIPDSPGRPSNRSRTNSSLKGKLEDFLGVSGRSMSRSTSSSSVADVSEFGTLFESGGYFRKNRGMSLGHSPAPEKERRKRADSDGSSLSAKAGWTAGLRVPSALGRSRSNTDPRISNFGSSSSQDVQLSYFPLFPPGLSLPTASSEIPPSTSSTPHPTREQAELNLTREKRKPPTPISGETPKDYIERLRVEKFASSLASVLASQSDPFHAAALEDYLSEFDFASEPLDISLRKFLLAASLPPETQAIDRMVEQFSRRYRACNDITDDGDAFYILAFSLVMLSTDLHNPSNKNKMSKADYVRNTRTDGIEPELLEYFFDQISVSAFQLAQAGDARPSEALSSIQPSDVEVSSSSLLVGNSRNRLDPYYLISRNLVLDLHINLESSIPLQSPLSFTGSTPFFNVTALHRSFSRSPTLQVTPGSSSTSGHRKTAAKDMVFTRIKIVKVGNLSRKEEAGEGGKKRSRKWRGYTVILTGTQLLFFKNPTFANTLHEAIAKAKTTPAGQNLAEPLSLLSAFRPDSVLPLLDTIAVFDSTYSKYQTVFSLVGTNQSHYLFQARDDDDMNNWISHINYAAAFKSAGIRMRSIPRPGSASPSSFILSSRDSSTTPPLSVSQDSLASMKELPEPSRDVPPSPSFDSTPSTARRISMHHEWTGTPDGSRAELLRDEVRRLDTCIVSEKNILRGDLRRRKHLAVLAPILPKTRQNLEFAVIPPLAKRVRAIRLSLARLVCYREVLTRDLLVENREQGHHSRRSSQNKSRLSPSVTSSEATRQSCDTSYDEETMTVDELLRPSKSVHMVRTSSDIGSRRTYSTPASEYEFKVVADDSNQSSPIHVPTPLPAPYFLSTPDC